MILHSAQARQPRPLPAETRARLEAKPLYIASGSDTRVWLDGRALCVQREC